MRLFLLMPTIVLEKLLLAISWVIAGKYPGGAQRISSWASKNLPTLDWYLGAAPMNDKVDE